MATSSGFPSLRHFSQWVDKSCGVPDMRPVSRRPFDQAAVVADVAFAGFGIFGDPMTGGDVRPVIETRRRHRHGKFHQTAVREQLIAFVDFFLARAGRDDDRLDQMIHRVDPAIGDFIGLAFETQAINRFGAGKPADENLAVVFAFFAVGNVVEQKPAPRFFRYAAAKLPAHQRLQLAVFVDFSVNAVKFVVRVQGGDELAQIFIRFSKIHRIFVYAFFPAFARSRAEIQLQTVTDP